MKIIKVSQKNLKKTIEEAGKAIEIGEGIVCPTDTVYGLLADATNRKAIRKIFKIKKRKTERAIPIFAKDIKMAKKLAYINTAEEKILRKYWPGKATFILKRKDVLPKIIFGKEKNIGLRIPKYKAVSELLGRLNRPLTGTSANISGRPASTKIKEVIKQFEGRKNKPDLIMDAGNLKPSKPSTIIDLTGKRFKILRRGAVKFKA